MSFASRGSTPRNGLECLLMKMGRTRPLVEPRTSPQAGKSGHPKAQNTDNHRGDECVLRWFLCCFVSFEDLRRPRKCLTDMRKTKGSAGGHLELKEV